jgi:putative DNA methylase
MDSTKKKLIEVALPLEAINKASAREKSIRHGHPSTLHLWWARRPLAAARAVIFAQMVDDPSSHPELFPTEEEQEKERQRLFRIIEDLVLWENTTNEEVLNQARQEIWKSWRYTCEENKDHPHAADLFNPDKLPAFHDPFAGGGALPLEAQRLGLESYASDLNPVAVLINKAMIEIPPKFANMPPVNPESRKQKNFSSDGWKGAQGLAEDVRYYGQWMRDEAEKLIGHLYPKVEITEEMAKERPDLEQYVGQKLTVIAWLWARTVKSPNPAFAHVNVPLVSSFMLSTKKGKEAYIEPVIEGDSYRFMVKMGMPDDTETAKSGTKLSRGANFECLMSKTPISQDYVRGQFKTKRNGEVLMAIVAEGDHGRVYISPTSEQDVIAQNAHPTWLPEQEMNQNTSNLVSGRGYGIAYWHEIFTHRQLVTLTTFSDLILNAQNQVKQDALVVGMSSGDQMLDTEGNGAQAYAEAVSMYLAIALNKVADRSSMICGWDKTRDSIRNTFGRQAIPMVWDFAESNPFSNSSGGFLNALDQLYRVMFLIKNEVKAKIIQDNAQTQCISKNKLVSTDPPYYDNIAYADLSDFFYIWLRKSMKPVFPNLFATLSVPKDEEIVADSNRHGSKEKAEAFFMDRMTKAMHRLAEQSLASFPVTIYYAFRQSETKKEGTSSTGWETFLEAVIKAGFLLSGTWPIRTELSNRMIGSGTNVLASSVVLVCRKRDQNAPIATRREFLNQLKVELPEALKHLQHSNIAPVDLAQAAIGPGMGIFTRYSKVIDAEGNAMTVREALALINQILDEVLAEQEGDFDADSRWALSWFEQYGFAEGEYGVAETLSKAKNTSVSGLVEAGILASKAGKVRLLKPDELPEDWDPATDERLTVWEMVHHLIRVLEADGEIAAAELVARLGSKADVARELAYRLYTQCERKKRAQEALAYNSLVQSWPEIVRLAKDEIKLPKGQTKLTDE